MMLQAKAAFGDDDDSLSHTGLCSDFYVFEWVLTQPERWILREPLGIVDILIASDTAVDRLAQQIRQRELSVFPPA